jgi:hypothetical protein
LGEFPLSFVHHPTSSGCAAESRTVIYIIGDNSDNAVTVDDFGNGNIDATITSSTNVASRSASNIKSIIIKTKDGFDSLDYNLLDTLSIYRVLAIDMGNHDDTVNLNFGGQTIQGPALLITASTGAGADQVNASFSDINNTQMAFTTLLGSGDDSFAATLDGDLFGYARSKIAVFGSYGNDSISVDASADVDLTTRYNVLSVCLDGGFHDDTIDFSYQGELDGVLVFKALGYYGNDTINGNITADLDSSGYLTAVELGGPGDDDLTLAITDDSGGTLHLLLALIDGGSGFDTCTHTSNVTTRYCEVDIVI